MLFFAHPLQSLQCNRDHLNINKWVTCSRSMQHSKPVICQCLQRLGGVAVHQLLCKNG